MTYIQISLLFIIIKTVYRTYKLDIEFPLSSKEWKEALVTNYLNFFINYDFENLEKIELDNLIFQAEKLQKTKFKDLCKEFISKYNKNDIDRYQILRDELDDFQLKIYNMQNNVHEKNIEIKIKSREIKYNQQLIDIFLIKRDIYMKELEYNNCLKPRESRNNNPVQCTKSKGVLLFNLNMLNGKYEYYLNSLGRKKNIIEEFDVKKTYARGIYSRIFEKIEELKAVNKTLNNDIELLKDNIIEIETGLNILNINFGNTLEEFKAFAIKKGYINSGTSLTYLKGDLMLDTKPLSTISWPKSLKLKINIKTKRFYQLSRNVRVVTTNVTIKAVDMLNFRIKTLPQNITKYSTFKYLMYLKYDQHKYIPHTPQKDIIYDNLTIGEIKQKVKDFMKYDIIFQNEMKVSSKTLNPERLNKLTNFVCTLIVMDIKSIVTECEIVDKKLI